MVMLRIANCRTEKARPAPPQSHAGPIHRTPQSIAHEPLNVSRGTTACGCGTVGIESWGGARGDCVTLLATARNFLFLGRSRCGSGGAQNNDSGHRKYRPDRHFRLLVRSGLIAGLPSQTPAASDHSINHEPPGTDQGRRSCKDFKGRSGRASQQKRLSPVSYGSSASDRHARDARGMSASPRKRTNSRRFGKSALCHKRTHAPQQTDVSVWSRHAMAPS